MLKKYSKIEHLTHESQLLNMNVVVQEKVDGSQFVFGLNPKFYAQTKRGISLHKTNTNFSLAVEHLRHRAEFLTEGYVYYGECLTKPKHNRICYDRTPKGFVVLFDVFDINTKEYLQREQLQKIADRLEIDIIPELYCGKSSEMPETSKLLNNRSFLGYFQIEGIVIKSYTDKKIFKVVSDKFRELSKTKKKKKPTTTDEQLDNLFDVYNNENRWHKAVQHLRDEGKLDNSMSDVGRLLKELSNDFEEECKEDLKEKLYCLFRKNVLKKVCSGFAGWYKKELHKNEKN